MNRRLRLARAKCAEALRSDTPHVNATSSEAHMNLYEYVQAEPRYVVISGNSGYWSVTTKHGAADAAICAFPPYGVDWNCCSFGYFVALAGCCRCYIVPSLETRPQLCL